MAIIEAWTAPDTLEFGSNEYVTAAELNAILGNLAYLHAGPRVALKRDTDQTGIAAETHTAIEWSGVVASQDDWGMWDSGSPTVAVIQEAGVYLFSLNAVWDGPSAGPRRQARLLRDGDPIRDDVAPGVSYSAHGVTWMASAFANEAYSVDVRHNDTTQTRTIESRTSPQLRSPLLIIQWVAPLVGS